MPAILVTMGTKYACNLSLDEDQICLQSWFKRGPNMPAISVTLGTIYACNRIWNGPNMPAMTKRFYICRISIFKKPADNLFLRGFWDEKSRDANGFSIWPHLTLTGPLVKIGGLRHIFESYLYRYDSMFYRFCNLSVTPFRQQNIFKTFFKQF